MFPLLSLLVVLLACSPQADDSGLGTEPLDLPEDPAATGVPVGVRTVQQGSLTVELWYPAGDAVAGQPGETVDTTAFVPQSVQEHIGPLTLPGLQTIAVRDAPARRLEAPAPVVLFSHGFGGFRQQSVDLVTHLASRGYVVAAPDHPGRMLGDALPCLFSPPLDGCDLTGFTSDPGPDDLADALALVSDLAASDWLSGVADPARLAVAGHSAGAGSTTSFGQEQAGVSALLPMAGGAAVTAELPTLFMGGTCDPFPGMDAVTSSATASAQGSLVALDGAGHLAFTDLCELDLGTLADEYLDDRDDLNSATYDLLLELATSGCPGAEPDPGSLPGCTSFLDLAISDRIVRHYATTFLDLALRESGPGVEAGLFEQAEVTP